MWRQSLLAFREAKELLRSLVRDPRKFESLKGKNVEFVIRTPCNKRLKHYEAGERAGVIWGSRQIGRFVRIGARRLWASWCEGRQGIGAWEIWSNVPNGDLPRMILQVSSCAGPVPSISHWGVKICTLGSTEVYRFVRRGAAECRRSLVRLSNISKYF